MSLLVAINGQNYIIPEPNEVGWGSNLDDFFVAISNGTLQKTGGSFTLSAETDFGTTYGLKSAYYKSRASNVASTGAVRLANAETGIVWRNAANNADLALTVNASNQLSFNGTPIVGNTLSSAHIFVGNVSNVATDVAMTGDISIDNAGLTAIGAGKIVNAQVNASAAIAYSKLALTGSIVNADVNASAAIAYSKLSLTGGIVNADVNASAAIAYSKLNLATSIVNADVSASAAIAYSKLNLATSIVNADVSASAAIAYSKLNLATSIVNADISTSAAIARSKVATGTAYTVVVNSSTGALSEVAAVGSSGQVLTSNGAGVLPTFQNVAGSGTVNSGTANQLAYYATSTNAVSGLTLITGSRALASDANGLPVAATTTATELGYVNGVTSAIQTQIDTKASTSSVALKANIASPTFTGTVTAPNLALTDVTNQIVLGATRTVTLTAPTPATSSRTWTFPDLTTSPTVAALEGTQTFSGAKTFSSTSGITASAASNSLLTLQTITNTDNTSSSSKTRQLLSAGGTSAGEVYTQYTDGTISYCIGMQPSVSEQFVIALGTALTGTQSVIIDKTNGNPSILGTPTNNNASAGYVGEAVRSSVTVAVSSTGNGQFFDITNISLTAGDWDISGQVIFTLNGATQTVALMAITSTSGNSTTGQIDGDNRLPAVVPVTANDSSATIAGYRVSLSGSATYYLKARCDFSAGTPKAYGRISARRVR